ncbi:hypothetical protein [Conchiformibius steedae]|uniref:Uncharacterized protein n=1 Tax=Conchiformibius steedae TaxID=153493 RepID=A0A3P2A5C6_9NEIS|nr:hypothetical protein [Conchiformibius steedae]RRD90604.1 hypothetical protein EII21_04840 [Conchiformibius steedae]
MSKNEDDFWVVIGGAFWYAVYIFLGMVMPIYAVFKDYQAGKIIWASIDFIIFPIGSIRGLMYLFGF